MLGLEKEFLPTTRQLLGRSRRLEERFNGVTI
jgi:hypothetical protein